MVIDITKIDFNTALITGGAGFIGSYIAEKLVEAGIDTRVIDNLVTGKKENLAKKELSQELVAEEKKPAEEKSESTASEAEKTKDETKS